VGSRKRESLEEVQKGSLTQSLLVFRKILKTVNKNQKVSMMAEDKLADSKGKKRAWDLHCDGGYAGGRLTGPPIQKGLTRQQLASFFGNGKKETHASGS